MAAHEDVSREATFGSLPVTRDERVWNHADFTWVNVDLAIATWAFLVGGATALMVGFAQGMLAMLIGNAIGVVIMLLASVVSSQRYGVEQRDTGWCHLATHPYRRDEYAAVLEAARASVNSIVRIAQRAGLRSQEGLQGYL